MTTIWTQADADKLKAAIISLASGEAVLSVSYNGPPARTVTYQQRNLGEMRALLALIQQELRADSNNPPYRLAATSKGV